MLKRLYSFILGSLTKFNKQLDISLSNQKIVIKGFNSEYIESIEVTVARTHFLVIEKFNQSLYGHTYVPVNDCVLIEDILIKHISPRKSALTHTSLV